MKILVISHTYVTPMNQRKINALTNDFKSVHLICPKKVKDTLRTIHFNLLESARFKAHPIQSYFGFHNSFRVYNPFELKKVFQFVRPDIVLLEQEPYSISTYQVARLKERYNFKLITFTFQNLYKKYPFPFSWFEKQSLELSDHLIVGNESGIDVWREKNMAPDKMSILPQVGVDIDEFYPMSPDVFKSKNKLSGFLVGYAGRFVEEKGLELLIRAFSRIENKQANLVFAGRGPEKKRMMEVIVEENLTKRVRFIENLTHEEMNQFMNAIDVLVLPSLIRRHWREQFGHVLIEAMACGTPCISTNIDPMNKIIADTGLVFKENDIEDLTDKLNFIMEDRNRRPLKAKCVQRVRENYLNSIISTKLLQLSQKLYENEL